MGWTSTETVFYISPARMTKIALLLNECLCICMYMPMCAGVCVCIVFSPLFKWKHNILQQKCFLESFPFLVFTSSYCCSLLLSHCEIQGHDVIGFVQGN